MAQDTAYEQCSLLQNTAAGLSEHPFGEAYEAALEQARAEGLLTEEGFSLLQEFGSGCGRYDLTRQTEHIAYCRQQLEDLGDELSRRGAVQGRLYRVAGMAGGVALALLLL